MKLTAIRLRVCVAPPQHSLTSTSSVNDYFAAGEYAIETRGDAWLKVTHVATGKSRLYPQAWCCGADELVEAQQQQPQHGRRK